jgi:hypothetical protein
VEQAERERYRRLHDGVFPDPEAVWPELRNYLCDARDNPHDPSVIELIEDLMFWHADAFVRRMEKLADDCPSIREMIAAAYVGGTAAACVDRFDVTSPDPG